MPDLLTHVFVGYILGTATTRLTNKSRTPLTTVVMLGALLPDLTKIQLLITDTQVEAYLGIPFSWFALHTLGGVLTTAGIGAVIAASDYRRRVFSLLLLGAFSHLVLDSMLYKPTGYVGPLWWPLVDTALPTPGLYLSFDIWPSIVTGLLAFSTYLYTRYD
jgi:hypothetical protein